jgi:UDPglucose 6-dehydrogenase
MVHHSVGVIGAGYVGLVTAACLADLGESVLCADIDGERIDGLRRGEIPIHEPGLDDLVARNATRLSFTTDVTAVFATAPTVFVCVDTPSLPSGDADLSRIESVLTAIPADAATRVLVMKSTVPVGTGARIAAGLARRGLTQVHYVCNPEFLREGSALNDFTDPDRVVIGSTDAGAAASVARLFAPLRAEHVVTDVASAEMIKLASNAFLATKISFINEIANVCEQVGADVEVVAHGMGLDPRIGPSFLRAGIGYGGSCFPKDVSALKRIAGNTGYHFQLLASVIEVNELQKRRLLTKLVRHLGSLQGKRVAVLGLAFKPNTDDVREAPSIVIASRLLAEAVEVVAYDPVAGPKAKAALPQGVLVTETLEDAVAGADAAVIVTEWPEFRRLLDPSLHSTMTRPLVVDGRNMLQPLEAAAAGLVYEGIGRAGQGHP